MNKLMIDKRRQTACFTGHREIRGSVEALEERVYQIVGGLIQEGYCYFGAGGARGFDALAARTVLKVKEQHPQVHLILVLPFYNQYEKEKGWTAYEIAEYQELKQKASKVVHLQEQYSSGCYYRRNRHLVDFSSVCIAYQYKETGGTAYTTNYARSQKVKIIDCFEESGF